MNWTLQLPSPLTLLMPQSQYLPTFFMPRSWSFKSLGELDTIKWSQFHSFNATLSIKRAFLGYVWRDKRLPFRMHCKNIHIWIFLLKRSRFVTSFYQLNSNCLGNFICHKKRSRSLGYGSSIIIQRYQRTQGTTGNARLHITQFIQRNIYVWIMKRVSD